MTQCERHDVRVHPAATTATYRCNRVVECGKYWCDDCISKATMMVVAEESMGKSLLWRGVIVAKYASGACPGCRRAVCRPA